MAKAGSAKSLHKKPTWILDAEDARGRGFSRRAQVTIALIVGIPALLFMTYQILFAPKVKSAEQAIGLVMQYTRSDGKTYEQWVRDRVARLCDVDGTSDMSFDLTLTRDAPPRGMDRYDVFVIPAKSSAAKKVAKLPLDCPERQPLAGVWAKDAVLVGLDKDSRFTPTRKIVGPALPTQFWLVQFANGEKP